MDAIIKNALICCMEQVKAWKNETWFDKNGLIFQNEWLSEKIWTNTQQILKPWKGEIVSGGGNFTGSKNHSTDFRWKTMLTGPHSPQLTQWINPTTF